MMKANLTAQKNFVIDANLIAPYQTRVFIGLLAEYGHVTMGGPPAVMPEIQAALYKIHSRHALSAIELESKVASQFDEAKNWISHYRAGGIWRDWTIEDYRTDVRAREIQALLESTWSTMKTDEEDHYLVETAVMCELDGLCSANMNMIEDDDWHTLMSILQLSAPPLLCRRENIVDNMSGHSDLRHDPKAVINIILPVMRPTDDFRTPLLKWSREINAAFPELSGALGKALGRMSETELQQLYQESVNPESPQHPVTRDYLLQP